VGFHMGLTFAMGLGKIYTGYCYAWSNWKT